MKPATVRAPLAILMALAVASAQAQTPAAISDNTPVIEAGGSSLTKAEFEQLLSSDSRYQGAAGQAASRRSLAVNFGKALALETEARARKLDQVPSIQLKIRHATQQILAFELLSKLRRDYLKDEAKLAAVYEQNKASYSQPKVRQILIRVAGSEVALRPGTKELSVAQARAKAVALRAKLAAGADFAALAKLESDDLGSRTKGGEMGYVARGATGAEFEAAAFSLPIGALSEVVQTAKGFHILRVEDRQPVPLSAVKAVIANELAHRETEGIMTNGYKLNDSYFPQ
jgi:peptidyl-prolyl cis-trans isomerase C